jgi:hypothetical protein
MDKHREYVQERMNGMYNIIEEFNNPILEAVKKDNHKKMCQVSFLNYLEYKYDDKNVKYEIKAAETDAEKLKVVKKYAKDYEAWKKRTKGLSLSWIGALIAQLSIGAAPITLCAVSILLYGNVIRILLNDEKERNEIGTAKYKKENKK